uniref:Uncharacterized protein n=1 Tax=Hucho hucho TaxID=62062 RepID=A0A4W5JY35_9TELE
MFRTSEQGNRGSRLDWPPSTGPGLSKLLTRQYVTEPKASVSQVTTISMSSLVLFLREVLREVPGWLLWVGVFLPVTLLLIQIVVYLNWKLKEGNLTALCFNGSSYFQNISYG